MTLIRLTFTGRRNLIKKITTGKKNKDKARGVNLVGENMT